MRSKQQLDKTLKITFASLSRKSDEKENKKKQTRTATAKLFAFNANAIRIEKDKARRGNINFSSCLSTENHVELNIQCIKYQKFKISRFARRSAETVPFHKIYTLGSLGKFWCFAQ